MSHTFTVVNQERIVKISDAALLEPYTARVEAAANDAEASAATALAAAGPNYSTDAAGLAAVAEGEAYALDNGDGTITIKKKVSGVAVAQRTIIKDPSASTAAALIGTASGDTAEDLLSCIVLPDQTVFSGSLGLGNGLSFLSHTTGDEGKYNVAIGFGALEDNTTGYYHTAVGWSALKAGGKFGETAVGFQALFNTPIMDRFDNTALGALALLNCNGGIDNVAVGIKSMVGFENGSENTCVGGDTMRPFITGNGITAIGNMAGRFLGDGVTNKTAGDYSIYLGWRAWGSSENDAQNEIVIGVDARGRGSNTTVIGSDATVETYLRGGVFSEDHATTTSPANAYIDSATGEIKRVSTALSGTWTPTLKGTVNGETIDTSALSAHWVRHAGFVFYTINLTVNGADTATGFIRFSLPTTAAESDSVGGYDYADGEVMGGYLCDSTGNQSGATGGYTHGEAHKYNSMAGITAGGRRFVITGKYREA